jgi:hypothetical protein
MYVEYAIPVKLVSSSSINGKKISIGWKINGFDPSASAPTATSTSLVGVPAGSGPPSGGGRGGGMRGGGVSPTGAGQGKFAPGGALPEQSIWAKYDIK